MKRLPTAALFVGLLLFPLAAHSAPLAAPRALPPDVPASHWAAGSVQRVEHEKIMGRDVDGRFRGNKPVTRYELAVALDRFVRYIEAAHKPLHAEVTHPAPSFPRKSSPAVRQALAHLVSNGFLTAASPLLTKNGHRHATAQELTDALASVTIRLSDRAEPLQQP